MAAMLGILTAALLFAAPGSDAALQLEARPQRVVLGSGGPETVELVVTLPGARATDLVLDASAGKLTDVRQQGPGQFVARLLPPADLYPQVAVVSVADVRPVAANAPPRVATVVVSYQAQIELKGTSEAQAVVQVQLGKETFGPTSADASGHFTVPVVVPPGEEWATVIATDRLGNRSRSRVSLYLPALQRLHGFLYPEALTADGKAQGWLFVTALDRTGAPLADAFAVTAERGSVGKPEAEEDGGARIAYTAPARLHDGEDRLQVRGKRVGVTRNFVVPLLAGPPMHVELEPLPAVLLADGRDGPRVVARLTDAQGNPASGHDVIVTVDGRERRAEESPAAPGRYELLLPARRRAGEVTILVRALPRTSQCVTPSLVARERAMFVVDRRGLCCRGSYQLVSAAGAKGAVKEHVEAGVPLDDLAGATHLEMKPPAGRVVKMALASVAKGSSAAEVAHAPVTLRYRLPAPLELSIEVLEKRAHKVLLRLHAASLPAKELAERVQLQSSAGHLSVLDAKVGQLDVELSGVEAATDVVATDQLTGVSAWARVP